MNNKSKLFQIVTLAGALFTLAGCQVETGADDSEEEVAAVPVETTRPFRGDIQAIYSGTAAIEAFADAVVIAKVGGEVREILVEEGDAVTTGQILARLDGDRLRLEAQQAAANLRKLRRDHERNVELRDKGLISAGDFDNIQYEMEALQAQFDLATLEHDYTKIRSPIDGVVFDRQIKIGNTIEAGAATFQVTSLKPLIVYLHVPEREYRRITPGQETSVVVDALSGAAYPGVVARVSPVVDPQTGTFKITIEVNDESDQLKPGMFGRINIVYETRANTLQIPRSAVIDDADSSHVFVVNGDKAEQRNVRLGHSSGGNVEILDGLTDSDEVVAVGHTSLKSGSVVSVIRHSGGAAADDLATNESATDSLSPSIRPDI